MSSDEWAEGTASCTTSHEIRGRWVGPMGTKALAASLHSVASDRQRTTYRPSVHGTS